MSILSIDHWSYNEAGTVTVRAVVEDAIVLYPATMDSPEELGEALCAANVLVEPGDWPEDTLQQIDWLEDYQPNWMPIDDGGW